MEAERETRDAKVVKKGLWVEANKTEALRHNQKWRSHLAWALWLGGVVFS